MNLLFGQSQSESGTMWRFASKRKRTSCILMLAACIIFWIFFKDDGNIIKLTQKASLYIIQNKTAMTNILKERKKSLEETMKETAAIVDSRVEHMRKLCRSNFSYYNGYLNQESYRQHSIYNNRYKFIMCLAEKTGCSFFKRVLYFYSGHRKISNPFVLTLGAAHSVPQNTTNKLDEKDLAEMMSEYLKLIFVRDPFKRLFSGYVDKIFSRYDFWGGFSSGIISKFRNGSSTRPRRCGQDATFPEFVKFIVYYMSRRQKVNGHFLPIFQHCNPCSADYDFIGKLENFDNDATYLFKKLNLGHQEIVSKAKEVSIDDEFVDAATIVFSDRNNKILRQSKCFNWYNFTRRTWRKLQIKGLISTKIPFPLTIHDLKLMTMPQFVTLLKAAHKDSFADPSFNQTKKYAFLEAYYAVPRSDLEQLADLMRPESEIWGYPVRPKELFDYKNRIPLKSFRFFNFDDV